MHATFLAKPMAQEASSALHVHQSIVDKSGRNVFSTSKGEPSDLFYGFLGGLHRHIYASLQALQGSAAMRSILGDKFVELYCAVKDDEYREFQEIITPWEREILMFNV